MNKPNNGRYPGPTSNAERQRQFRKRNPGYYGRWHRKHTAEIKAAVAAMQAAQAAAKALPAPTPLLLPAPVEQIPLFTIPVREPEAVEVVSRSPDPQATERAAA